MAQESNVQVPPSSTGGIIRMLQVTVLDSGTPTTVLMQVIGIADEYGNPITYEDSKQVEIMMLDELRAIRLGIQELISAGAKPHDVFNLIEVARELRLGEDDPVIDQE